MTCVFENKEHNTWSCHWSATSCRASIPPRARRGSLMCTDALLFFFLDQENISAQAIKKCKPDGGAQICRAKCEPSKSLIWCERHQGVLEEKANTYISLAIARATMCSIPSISSWNTRPTSPPGAMEMMRRWSSSPTQTRNVFSSLWKMPRPVGQYLLAFAACRHATDWRLFEITLTYL